jgi:hypothetical protein
MPCLWNHDHQIRPVGDQKGSPPPVPAYDMGATAFCKFFPLPGKRWIWHFDVPAFHARFIALDLSHINHHGTTRQSCHNFDQASEQFRWYKPVTESRPPGYLVVTLQNEHNSKMREQEGHAWEEMYRKGTIVVSGAGYYAQR